MRRANWDLLLECLGRLIGRAKSPFMSLSLLQVTFGLFKVTKYTFTFLLSENDDIQHP